MIDLKKITKGRVESPPRVCAWGFDGVGKSQFAAGAPDPFFIDANKGSGSLNVERIAVDTWEEAREWLDAVEAGQVKCKTLVLDSLTDLEAMSHTFLFPGSTIEKHDGGFGKGENVALSEWRIVLSQLERIWRKGIAIVIIAHATVKTFSDPLGPSFDRFEIAARPKLAGMIRQWVDAVLFCREDVIATGGKNETKRATTTGVRWIYTSRKPAYDAKTRGTSLFPERIPLSWKAFDEELKNDVARGMSMAKAIDSMLAEIADAKYEASVRAYLKEEPSGIVEAHSRVAAKLDEKRSNETKGV